MFSFLKDKGLSKSTKCSEGSVCAWEDTKGRLHRTKASRDKANESIILEESKAKVMGVLTQHYSQGFSSMDSNMEYVRRHIAYNIIKNPRFLIGALLDIENNKTK